MRVDMVGMREKATLMAQQALARKGYEEAKRYWTASWTEQPKGFSQHFDRMILDEIERLHKETLQ